MARGPHDGRAPRAAAETLGLPLRLKAATGGYDGRSQVRLATRRTSTARSSGSAGRPARPLLAEAELTFECELSIVVARGARRPDRGRSRSPATSTTTGSSSRAWRRRRSTTESPTVPPQLGERLAVAMGLTGTLTAELFLMPDGRLVVNELAPRVHNSGHWTIEGAATSQFEQHIRAICGLALGSTAALAPDRDGQPAGHRAAAGRPSRGARAWRAPSPIRRSHLHVYDKRQVFERRKMGHVTAIGDTVDEALDRARAAAADLRWAEVDADRRRDGAKERRAVNWDADGPPRVGVVGGSRSDFPVLEQACAVLDELESPSELRVVSAHRTPDHAVPLRRGGGRARDPGHRRRGRRRRPPARHARGQDRSCRSSACRSRPSTWAGLDSLLSIVQMPRGIPVATVAIGNAMNAGLLAARDPRPVRRRAGGAPGGLAGGADRRACWTIPRTPAAEPAAQAGRHRPGRQRALAVLGEMEADVHHDLEHDEDRQRRGRAPRSGRWPCHPG